MTLNEPSFIPEPWANQGQYDTIPATNQQTGRASWDVGFPTDNAKPVSQGGIPPHYKDFQGVLNALSSFAWWQQRGGQFTWSADLEYPVGAFVLGSDGALYKAIQASSPSDPQNPTTATAYWTIADPTAFLPLTGGTMTGDIQSGETLFVIQKANDTGTLIIRGGSDYGNGAQIYLRGKDHSTQPGWMYGHLTDGNIHTDFYLKPDGTFTWGNKNVERVDSSSIAVDNGYIRYTSGLQICWGKVAYSGNTGSVEKSATFSKAFNISPTIFISPFWAYSAEKGYVTSRSSTGFTMQTENTNNNDHSWYYLAIGSWS